MSKDLLQVIRAAGLDDYGSVIPKEFVQETLGIVVPKVGTKAQFDAAALEEISAVDYCRNVLLGEGKYLGSAGDSYRILLPSENAGQIEAYMRSADRKLSRAIKLSKASAAVNREMGGHTARAEMKRQGLRDRLHPRADK